MSYEAEDTYLRGVPLWCECDDAARDDTNESPPMEDAWCESYEEEDTCLLTQPTSRPQ
jgi:hypothetical protein